MLRRDLETKEKEKNQMAETNNQLNKDIHDLK
jgi:cell division protein FtsB